MAGDGRRAAERRCTLGFFLSSLYDAVLVYHYSPAGFRTSLGLLFSSLYVMLCFRS